MAKDDFIQKFIEKFSNSKEFAISFILHIFLVFGFGTAVLFEAVKEPPDFEGGEGGFVAPGAQAAAPPPAQQQITPQEQTFQVTTAVPQQTTSPVQAITTTATNALNFEMPVMIMPTQTMAPTTAAPSVSMAPPAPTSGTGMEGVTPQVAASIKEFASGWGKGTGLGTGTRQREFEFVAFVGKYAGGNWNANVRTRKGSGGKEIVTGGSIPNLLWIMNQWSRDKIKTNHRNIEVIDLASDEIFAKKPPFIFLTGTRDFKLTDKEVENLRKYVRMGGCIWGDSAVPGRNSRFDIAFRREMRRVIPDVDKDFTPLPPNHPIFTNAYFPEIRETPPGINFYREPVYALNIYGEIGILYTANDYADMWQIGLNEKGQVELKATYEDGTEITNMRIWENRHLYIGNITPSGGPTPRQGEEPVAQNIVDVYKFGINIIVHLLTRWDRVIARAPSL
ncbi:MAG: DUF4159 domain-containing protein [Chthoniobacterales bacterium]|nr:DUF4159 domain-containing protein [Chthoniobacterales bacterium]